MIVNEHQLNSAKQKSLKTIEQYLQGYLYNEGRQGEAPEGFVST